jgi:hypothetical protein
MVLGILQTREPLKSHLAEFGMRYWNFKNFSALSSDPLSLGSFP